MIEVRVRKGFLRKEVIDSEAFGITGLAVTITGDSIARFTELVSRALNCWDTAHPELKELSDMLVHGKILQDYYHQQGIAREE